MKRWFGLLCLFSLYSTESAHAAPLTFSLLTYNVLSGHVANDPSALKRLPLIGAKLNTFDIAGIQGCFVNCDLLLQASNHPDKYYFKDRPHVWNRVNSGLASLSNFPLIEVKKIFFRAQSDVKNEKASKGILLMRYDVDGHILDVYNTHMQTGPSQLDQTARTFQAFELVEYIWNESPAENSVVLHGDFDMGPARPAVIAKLKLKEPAATLVWPREATDRILFRSGSNTVFKPISAEEVTDVFTDDRGQPLSDSIPVAVTFQLD